MRQSRIFTIAIMTIFAFNLVIGFTPMAGAQSGGTGQSLIGRFDEGGINITHTFNGFTVITNYKSSDDFSAGWRITGNKAIDITLYIVNNTAGYTILIEHMHADIFIESTREAYDDLTQDSMDDYFHGLQGGFYVNETNPYHETFSIEGSKPEFQSNLKMFWDDYYAELFSGDFEFSEKFLTKDGGIFGQSLYTVFDVAFKSPSDQYFSKVIVSDNVFIDLNGNVYNDVGNYIDEQNEATSGTPLSWWEITLIVIGAIVILYLVAKYFAS